MCFPAVRNHSQRPRCLFLFLSLLALLLLAPVVNLGPGAAVMFLLLQSITLIAGISALRFRGRSLPAAVVLAVLQLAASVAALAYQYPMARYLALIFIILFYLYLLAHVLSYVLSREGRGVDRIIGGLSAYLLMGVAWGFLYILIEAAAPGSFATPGTDFPVDGAGRPDLIYFSFVTLTTLGFGEIVPASPLVRPITILEALAGVFFMAVLVARLVGSYSTDPE
ncbi:MAG TPA: ion channel [Acidobacteriota bacterium]|nr:ion channel [Acidobacteriota bacterium]